MSDLSTGLLLQLKDYSNCNDDLAVKIRKVILEPFQVDVSRPEVIKKPPPSPARFKQMATQLAPVAMRIVNQNIQALVGIKRVAIGNYTIAVNCLVDTSFYALAALRHMNTFTALKPLDIEKTTSNLICKMVELGEYNRALDEIRKFRSVLASAAKISLENKFTVKSASSSPHMSKGILTESANNQQTSARPVFSPVPESLITNQWEEDMLHKYQNLFQFPLDPSIMDRTMILLVLAYQMNTIRCWCEIGEGALSKYIPYLMEKPGNFMDWSMRLMTMDAGIAKKQLDSFQKLLYKVANRYPLTESAAFHSYNIQVVALNTMKVSGTAALKSVMDRFVRIGVTYEKTNSHTQYQYIQKKCIHFLQDIHLNMSDYKELDSYFVLCEYLAYVSRRSKSHEGAFTAYNYMMKPLENLTEFSYYQAAYAATAKLSMGSLQMDKMVTEDTFSDIRESLTAIVFCLRLVSSTLKSSPVPDEHSESALSNLCKSMDGFRQSCKRLFEFVLEKSKQSLVERKNNLMKTPPRSGEIATPSDFGQWNSNMAQLSAALQQCSETLPANLCLVKKKTQVQSKRETTQQDIMISFIDIIVLLARMCFNINKENTHHTAYEYLSTAEQLCAKVHFTEGYRWLSVSYYNLGATMIKTELYEGAIYPLRKSCVLLEKDTERINSEEGKLQICKRYEILGTCCQKNERFDEAIKAYRMALQRAPLSTIQKFVQEANTTAVSTIIEKDPLLPKLIDRFLRASIIDPHQAEIRFASEFMSLSSLTDIDRCIIYECELKVWNALSHKMNLIKYQMSIVNRLLECYDGRLYPIRRARILLTQVRIERSRYNNIEHSTRTAMACAKEAIQLLKVQQYERDSNLLKYRLHYIGLASSWIAICTRELEEGTPNSFYATLQQWGILLKRITPIYNSAGSSKADIQHVYESVDDLDQFYDHARMLSDLFGVTGQCIYQINALRILLKLNNGFRDVNVDHISESIILSSTIGKIYCDLGYTEKASVEFKHAQNAIANRPCDNTSELVYRVNYAYYLTVIGDYETSKQVFDATRFTWETGRPIENKSIMATAKSYTNRCMLLADVYTTKAMYLAQTDTLDSAIVCATGALQLLNKCIKVTQKATEDKKPIPDPFNSTSTGQQEAKQTVFRESQWTMAQKVGASLLFLASLHMKKGSWNEAKYFVKQGPLLAEKVNSGYMFFNAYLCASEFYLRSGDLVQSQEAAEKALALEKNGQALQSARVYEALANLAVANDYHTEAIQSYGQAIEALHTRSSDAFISTLEELTDIKEHSSREVKVVFEDQVKTTECVPLMQLECSNRIHRALALCYGGDVKGALTELESLEELTLVNHLEVELMAAISSVRMTLFRQDIAQQSDAQALLNGSLSLPGMKIQLARGASTRKLQLSQERRLIRDHLSNVLESMTEAYRMGSSRERSSIIQSLCNESGFAMFFKNQLYTTSNRTDAKDTALYSAYYMEMAKGINLRREMQFCLDIKMNKTIVGQSPNDTHWPLSEGEQDELSNRLSMVSLNPKWLQSHLQSLSEAYRDEPSLNDGEFQERFVDILPVNWTVCSLTLDPIHHDLYAVQMRQGETPFVVKIPLKRSATRSKKYNTIQYNDAVETLQEIIRLSDDTIHNSDKTQPDQVDHWWTTRIDLDNKLKVLLESIESHWFSGFKGLLSGRRQEHKEELNKFQKSLSDILYKTVNAATPTKKMIEFNLSFCRMILCLGRHPAFRELEDLIYFAFSCYEAQPLVLDYSKIDVLKTAEKLKALLVRYHEQAGHAGLETNKTIPNDHVILILDKFLQMFPLESIPILRPQSTSRLPCLSFLRDRILYTQSYHSRVAFDDFGVIDKQWKDMTVSRTSAFYVLNPGGDLKDTQKEFEPIFKNVPEWDGVAETMPMEFQCKEALQSRDIYMYFGHSAGQAFMRGTSVRQLPTCAVSLLMGCSSGVLEANGEFDPYGYILNYLLAGSPAVVGNLWDVTDRSIDRLTKYMLRSWGLLKTDNVPTKPKSLVQAVTESRAQCKLPYLIGAAPVVYGIPVYVNPQ